MISQYRLHLILLLLLSIGFSACTSSEVRRKLRRPEQFLELDANAEYMKVHFRDGGLSVLSNWSTYDTQKIIIGEGRHYNASRVVTSLGIDTIPFEKIALLESNTVISGGNLAGMLILTGGTIGVAIYCAMNP